jgi:hypothetical protein
MRRALRIVEIGSLFWWLFALGVTNLFTISLPYLTWRADYQGCVRMADMIPYVECGQSWFGQFLGNLLTWAMLWMLAAWELLDMLTIPILLPLVLVWIASVILALACLFRMMLALVRAYRGVKA